MAEHDRMKSPPPYFLICNSLVSVIQVKQDWQLPMTKSGLFFLQIKPIPAYFEKPHIHFFCLYA